MISKNTKGLLSLQDKKTEDRMTREEDDQANDDIENDIFGLFELLLVPSGDEDEPSCIDDEEHTDNREEGIDIVDDISDNPDAS